jgi:hypothetical protein
VAEAGERAMGRIRADAPAASEGLSIRTGELIAVIAAVLAVSILVWHRDRIHDWWPAAGWYAFMAALPLVLRALQARFPGRTMKFVADMSMTVYIVGFYLNLNPVLDAVNMGLADDYLVRADQRLFGTQISVSLQHVIPPLLNDLFLAAYTTHFFWPLILGLVLWFRRKDEAFDEWATAVMFFFAVNYAFYAIVPAIGPRYFQAAFFDGPVQGHFLAHKVEMMFRGSPLARDCFPSGHTGCALLVLTYMWRFERKLFFFSAPILVCLIAATLAGRFHYGVDLVAAVPLTGLSVAVARALTARLPEGLLVVDRMRLAAFATSLRRAWAEVRGHG